MPQRRISPQVELWAVKEELELATKTIDHYTHLVTKLYNELDALHNGICNKCKSKFVLGPASFLSPGRSLSSSSPTESQPVLGSRQTEVLPDLRRNAEPSTQRESTSIPSTQLRTSAAVEKITNSPESKPDEADWSVVHNHEVRQNLDIHLAHTLRMKSWVNCVKFSQEGNHLAVGLRSGETYIYDMKTLSYRILKVVEYPAKKQPPINTMHFSPDDTYIAIGADDGQIRIWNLAQRRVLATLKGHTDSVLSVDFSPNSRSLLSSSFDGSVRIWCVRDGSSKKLLDLEMTWVLSAAISPDGRYVAAGDYGFLRIWDFRSGQLLQRWKVEVALWSVVFTSDGKRLLSGGEDMTLRCWDINSLMAGQSLGSRRRALVSGKMEEKECLSFHGHTGIVSSVSIFPGSRWVLSASADSTARIWDVPTGAWQCTLSGHKEAARAADVSPDGHHLATGSEDGSIRVWRYQQAG